MLLDTLRFVDFVCHFFFTHNLTVLIRAWRVQSMWAICDCNNKIKCATWRDKYNFNLCNWLFFSFGVIEKILHDLIPVSIALTIDDKSTDKKYYSSGGNNNEMQWSDQFFIYHQIVQLQGMTYYGISQAQSHCNFRINRPTLAHIL